MQQDLDKKGHQTHWFFVLSSMALGKHYRCFYYDNATLNIKSTLMDQRKDAFTVNNDMLLQLLDIKNDFEA